MKKALAIIIGMVLVLSLVCCVSAVEINANSVQKTTTTTVTFTIDKSYTVNIPPDITIRSTDGAGNGFFRAKINQIDANHYLNIVIKTGEDEDNYYNETAFSQTEGGWVLKHAGDEIAFLAGVGKDVDDHIDIGSGDKTLAPGNGVMSVHSDVYSEKVVVLHCMIPDFALVKGTIGDYAGDYSGQMIFEVNIDDEPVAEGTGYVFETSGTTDPNGNLVVL